jgi:hypothetical protein
MPACAESAGAAELAVDAEGVTVAAEVVGAVAEADGAALPLEPLSHAARPNPVMRTSPATVPLRM